MASKPYNGHPSWNAWNVSLWIGNDEPLYRLALDCLKQNRRLYAAAQQFVACVPARTPDGARYSMRSVMHALRGLES